MPNKKITETGPLNYRVLQELNNADEESRQRFLNSLQIANARTPGEQLLLGVASNDPVQIPANPDFGESRYDPKFPSLSQYYNPNQIRYEQQGAWARLGVGVAKILPRAISLVPETIGIAYAGAESLFTDKTFAESMREQFENNIGFKMDDYFDDALKIYRPDDYDNRSLLQRMGTSSFWADDILANLGFQFGSSAIFKLTTKAVSKALLKTTEKAIINGSKLARGAQSAIPMLTAGYVSSSGEANVEARGFYNDKIQTLQKDLYDDLQKQLTEIDSYSMASPDMANQIQNLKLEAINEYERKLEDAKKMVSDEAAKLYWYNKAVLGISNTLEFGLLFKSGFMGNISDIPTAVVKGELKNLTPKSALFNIAKGILAEGGEEGFQHIGTDIANFQIDKDYQDYINNAYSLHGLDRTKSFMSDFGKIAAENMNDVDFWEEFMAGAIMGGLFPHPRIDKTKKGKTGIVFEGGLTDLFTQKNKYKENQKKIDDLNSKLASFDNKTIIKAANAIFNSMERQQAAEQLGDKKAFEDENVVQAATLIASLSELGRGDLVLNRLNELEKYFSSAQNREKYATTDVSQGGASQKGSDGAELNEYARLGTDEERQEWLDKRFSKARQMVKDMNTIAYNIRRISPKEISSEDIIPIMIDRYRLHELEGNLSESLEDIRDSLLALAEVDNIRTSPRYNVNQYGDIYEDTEAERDVLEIEAGEQTSELNERISKAINSLKQLFDKRTLLENKADLNTKAILAKNLQNLLVDLITKYDKLNNPQFFDFANTVRNVNEYVGSYIDLHEKLNKILSDPSVVSEAREKAEQKLAQKQNNRKMDDILKQFNLADADQKQKMYDSMSDEEKSFIEKNADKEDVQLIKQKKKLKKAFSDAVDKVVHSAIDSNTKQNAKAEILNIINSATNSSELDDLSNLLERIYQFRTEQNIYKDYVIEQAMSTVSRNKAFESAFKNFVPEITSDQIELQAAMEGVPSNDGNGGLNPVVTKGYTSKEGEKDTQVTKNPSDNELKGLSEQPVSQERPKQSSEDKEFIYPTITEESKDAKYEGNHRPFWENDMEEKLSEFFKKENPSITDEELAKKIKEYIDNLKATPVSKVTAETTNPENIKNGTYRGYYDLWTYLENEGAFEYVNQGRLHSGDEVWFKVEKSLGDDVILIMTNSADKQDGQVIGILPERGVVGIKALRDAVKNGKNPKTKVTSVLNGIVRYGNTERNLNRSDAKDVLFAIVNENGEFKGLPQDVNIEYWNTGFAKFSGCVVALIKTSRGTYYPVPLRCKTEFNNFEDSNPVNAKIVDIITKIGSVKKLTEFNKLFGELAKLLYIGDMRYNAYTTGADGKQHEINSKNDNVDSDITALGFGSKNGTVEFVDMNDPNLQEKIRQYIVKYATRYNVTARGLSDKQYVDDLIESGILSSNVETFDGLHGSWFVLPYFDEKTGKFSDESKTPEPKGREKSPIKGTDSVKSKVFTANFQGNNIEVRVKNGVREYYFNGEKLDDSTFSGFINNVVNPIISASVISDTNGRWFEDDSYNGKLIFVRIGNYEYLVAKDKAGLYDVLDVEKANAIRAKLIEKQKAKQKQAQAAREKPVQSVLDSNDRLVKTYSGEYIDETQESRVVLSEFNAQLANKFEEIYFVKGAKKQAVKSYGLYVEEWNCYAVFENSFETNSNGEKFKTGIRIRLVSNNGASLLLQLGNMPIYVIRRGDVTNQLRINKEDILKSISKEELNDFTNLLIKKKGLPNTAEQSQKKSDNNNGQFKKLEEESLKFTQENGRYIHSDGTVFVRLHRLLEALEERKPSSESSDTIDTEEGRAAVQRGSRIDALLRHLFNTNGKDIEGAKKAANDKSIEIPEGGKYTPLNEEFMDSVIKSAIVQIKELLDKGYTFNANNIRVGTNINGLNVAGEIDLLLQDPDGTLYVYDFKTSKYGEGSKYYPTNNDNYITQLNFYAEALRKNGYNAQVGGIVTINTSSKSDDYGSVKTESITGSSMNEWKVRPFGSERTFSFEESINTQAKVENNEQGQPEEPSDDDINNGAPSAMEFDRLQSDNDTDEKMTQEELEWLRKTIPGATEESRIVFVDTLGKVDGRVVYGKFKDGVIYLLRGGIKGTAYHESFHYVSNALMSVEEQKEVYDAARKLWNLDNIRDIEEKLADSFMNYMIDEEFEGSRLSSSIKNIFKRIKTFLKTLFKVASPQDVLDHTFYKIKEGKYKNNKVRKFSGTYYRYSDDVSRILAAAGNPNFDLMREFLSEYEYQKMFYPDFVRGAKKFGYKPSDIHINYTVVNGNVRFNSINLKGKEIFNRNSNIDSIRETSPIRRMDVRTAAVNMMDITSLTSNQRDFVEHNIGVELWDTLDVSVRQEIIKCM